MGKSHRRKRARGSIEELPSGALRVRVYGGIDPLTKRPVYLRETIPPGPRSKTQAEKALTRLLSQVDEKRSPRTRATVNQLIDKWLGVIDVEAQTRTSYEGKIRKHMRSGSSPARKSAAWVLDATQLMVDRRVST